MKFLAPILIVLGLIGLLYGGVKIAYPDKVLDLGAVEVSVTKHKSLPLPPIIGAVALAAGVALLMANRRSTS